MGSVYLARDSVLDRSVAVKTISPELATSTDIISRFEQEARIAAQVKHKNVAQVLGFGTGNSSSYIVMEFVEGQTLESVVKQGAPLSIEDAWGVVYQAVLGLQAAHERGIIHRDIKPANLMVEADSGLVKVMDFGLSRFTAEKHEEASSNSPESKSLLGCELTQVGSILGTPMYMSPEQASSKKLDARSDIYSLGMTLYFLLSGKTPFESSSAPVLIVKQCTENPTPIGELVQQLNAEQQYVLDRMIAKIPEQRQQDYQSLLRELDQTSTKNQNQIASWFCRINALVISYLTESLFWLCALYLSFVPGFGQVFDPRSLSNLTCSVFFLTIVYVLPLWYWGQTPGKWLMGIRVVNMNGNPIKFWQAAVRSLVLVRQLYVPLLFYWALDISDPVFEPNPVDEDAPVAFRLDESASIDLSIYLFLLINLLIVVFARSRRGIHDRLAGTQVVEVPDLLVPGSRWKKPVPDRVWTMFGLK